MFSAISDSAPPGVRVTPASGQGCISTGGARRRAAPQRSRVQEGRPLGAPKPRLGLPRPWLGGEGRALWALTRVSAPPRAGRPSDARAGGGACPQWPCGGAPVVPPESPLPDTPSAAAGPPPTTDSSAAPADVWHRPRPQPGQPAAAAALAPVDRHPSRLAGAASSRVDRHNRKPRRHGRPASHPCRATEGGRAGPTVGCFRGRGCVGGSCGAHWCAGGRASLSLLLSSRLSLRVPPTCGGGGGGDGGCGGGGGGGSGSGSNNSSVR